MTEALITPDILSWARTRSSLSENDLARRTQVNPSLVRLWEQGNAKPSLRQAQNLARTLHIPFGYLFISEPPEERIPIPDLRTVVDDEFQTLSVDFVDLLNDVIRKHQWYIEYLQEQGASPLEFVGDYINSNDVDTVANSIRNIIGINDELRYRVHSWEEFLRDSIRRAEELGILVLRSGIVGNNTRRKLSVSEFRGFTIYNNMAPLIFINGRDAKAAQIFTFAHELCHVWKGESGISNPDLSARQFNRDLETEVFCNKVAAEILTPRATFLRTWDNNNSIENNLDSLVHYYRVSSLVVLRRAYELGLIEERNFFSQLRVEMEKHYRPLVNRDDGGDFYRTIKARNSNRLTKAILSSTFEGKLLYRDAARLLGVKVKTLEGIAESM